MRSAVAVVQIAVLVIVPAARPVLMRGAVVVRMTVTVTVTVTVIVAVVMIVAVIVAMVM